MDISNNIICKIYKKVILNEQLITKILHLKRLEI